MSKQNVLDQLTDSIWGTAPAKVYRHKLPYDILVALKEFEDTPQTDSDEREACSKIIIAFNKYLEKL